jgi:hypothetical protein
LDTRSWRRAYILGIDDEGGLMVGVVLVLVAGLAFAAFPDRSSAQAAVVWAVGDGGDGTEQAHAVGR